MALDFQLKKLLGKKSSNVVFRFNKWTLSSHLPLGDWDESVLPFMGLGHRGPSLLTCNQDDYKMVA